MATEPAPRTALRRLRATLALWGGAPAELRAFDAWAASVVMLLGARRTGPGKSAPVAPFASLDDAQRAAFELTLQTQWAAAGLAPLARRAAWRLASEGFELVDALLVRRSQREKGRTR